MASMATGRWLMVVPLLALSLPACRAQAQAPRQGGPPVPVLVELFTSEGCSSCPPADALLQKMIETQPAAGVEIIGLGEHVDYWDHQGWKDRFSSASFTQRQQLYGSRFSGDSIYTPQMVVDGRAEFVGSDGDAARKAIQRASTQPHGEIDLRADAALHLTISATHLPIAHGERADLLVAVTEDRLQSDVKRGENHGRVLTHAAVVRSLQPVGQPMTGDAGAETVVALDESWQRSRLKIVAFVQERRSRSILASAAILVPPR
jgi:hypothetical protein